MAFVSDFDIKGTNADRLALSLDTNQEGFRFFESDTGKSYRWDGSAWDLTADNVVSVDSLFEMIDPTFDCSANPNYPAGEVGDAYYVSVAGKIGGASGKTVSVGDLAVCKADNAGGTEASVGTDWFVLEHNLVGAMLGSNNLSDLVSMVAARANLGIEAAKVDVASGATTNIGAATSMTVRITGTTTITAFDTVADGIWRLVYFSGALTLTHNGTSLILPGGANITTAAGDSMLVLSLGSGNWKVMVYQKANGEAVVGGSGGGGYPLFGAAGNVNPSDGQTLYVGSNYSLAATPTADVVRIYIPKPGTITLARLRWYADTAVGTTENISAYVRLNNTSDTLIQTIGNNAAEKNFYNDALSIAVIAGDYVEIKIVCPTWTTNPTAVRFTAQLWIAT